MFLGKARDQRGRESNECCPKVNAQSDCEQKAGLEEKKKWNSNIDSTANACPRSHSSFGQIDSHCNSDRLRQVCTRVAYSDYRRELKACRIGEEAGSLRARRCLRRNSVSSRPERGRACRPDRQPRALCACDSMWSWALIEVCGPAGSLGCARLISVRAPKGMISVTPSGRQTGSLSRAVSSKGLNLS